MYQKRGIHEYKQIHISMQSLLNEFCNWKNLIKATNEATVYFSALGCFLFFFGGTYGNQSLSTD